MLRNRLLGIFVLFCTFFSFSFSQDTDIVLTIDGSNVDYVSSENIYQELDNEIPQNYDNPMGERYDISDEQNNQDEFDYVDDDSRVNLFDSDE